MNNIIIIGFITLVFNMQSLSLAAQDLVSDEAGSSLTIEDIAAFKQQAIATVTELSRYIKIIGEKSRSTENRRKTIDLSVKLFSSESNIIEVSSGRQPGTTQFSVRTYLKRLFGLDYAQVSITWYDIYLSRDFQQAPDGKYYGTATIYQRFSGWSNKELAPYSDITTKNIKLIIEVAPVYVGADKKREWILKLGDIKVEETR